MESTTESFAEGESSPEASLLFSVDPAEEVKTEDGGSEGGGFTCGRCSMGDDAEVEGDCSSTGGCNLGT